MENKYSLRIKNVKKRALKNILSTLLISCVVFFIFHFNNKFDVLIVLIIISFGSLFKVIKAKVIFDLQKDNNQYLFVNYSLLNGLEELKLKREEIIRIDFIRNNLIIKYEDYPGGLEKKFEIVAEPWDEIYIQIRSFKLDIEEFKKEDKEN